MSSNRETSERGRYGGRGRDEYTSPRDRDSGRDRGRDPGRDERPSRDRDDSRGRSRGGSSSYEYRARDAADVKKRSTQGANDFDKILIDSIKTFKVNDGDNRLRILPPTWEDAKHYGLDVYVHYGVGPDRGTYLCLDKMKGEPCPICEERAIARRDEDEKYAKELEPKRRVLVYAIDRDHEKEGVQAWAMPWTVDRDIVKVSVDKSSGEVLPIDHPEEGYDVEFEKKGAKDRTEYLGVAIARRSNSLGDDRWLDYAIENPLPDQLNYFDYDHIAKVFGGGGGPRETDRSGSSREESRGRDDRDRSSRDDRDGKGESSRGRDDHGRAGRDEPDRTERHSSRSSRASEEPTWDSIHSMTGKELEDLIDQEKLEINPNEAKDDDLADWICDEMKIKKAESSSRRTVVDDDRGSSDRLRDMRRGRD